jgi:FtsZ-interacting cell division protein ZipA
MQFNLFIVIGIALAAMLFGYVFGLFEGRGQGYKKRKREESEEKRMEPVIAAPAPVPPKENNLLKLNLDNNNQFQLELDGQRADSSQLAPEQRKRLIDLIVTMRPWIDVSAPKPSAPAQPVPPRPIPPAPIAAPVYQPVSKPIASSPAPVLSRGEGSKKEESTPTTMVGQIDAILQEHLASSLLANRAIRLMESPGGNVVVMVGLDKYNGVGDVPDPQVQAAIRAAIAEWEKKYTPGG